MLVKDMASSLRFYRLIGLDIPPEADSEHHVEIRSNGYRLAWDTVDVVKEFMGHWVEPVGHRMGLAFKCDNPGEVDRLYAAVTGAGYPGRTKPWDAFWGQRYAQVVDPDGNTIDLFAPLEVKI